MPYRSRSSETPGWLVLFSLVVMAPIIMLDGWVISVLWNWFIPNIFESMPKLSLGQAVGVNLVVMAFIYVPNPDEYDDPVMDYFSKLFYQVIRSFFLLFIGLVAQAIVF